MNELFNYKMRRLQGTIKIVQCNSETLRNNFFAYNHYKKGLFLQCSYVTQMKFLLFVVNTLTFQKQYRLQKSNLCKRIKNK